MPHKQNGQPHTSRRWCSSECADAFSIQHNWKDARKHVRERDGYACQSCGLIGWNQLKTSELDLESPQHAYKDIYPTATSHDQWRDFAGVYQRNHLPESIRALARSEKQANDRAGKHLLNGQGTLTHEIQIHHIHPVRGRRYGQSCLNHSDNLICLCDDCHKEVTRLQQKARYWGWPDVIALPGHEIDSSWQPS